MCIYIVDCTANPTDPILPSGANNWTVKHHNRDLDQLDLDMSKIELYLSKKQQGSDGCINGNQLRKELDGKLVLNANVIDFLLAHQYLIPEEWKGNSIFFWGTIYCDGSDNSLFVRYLLYDDYGWSCCCGYLDDEWLSWDYAAVLASH